MDAQKKTSDKVALSKLPKMTYKQQKLFFYIKNLKKVIDLFKVFGGYTKLAISQL